MLRLRSEPEATTDTRGGGTLTIRNAAAGADDRRGTATPSCLLEPRTITGGGRASERSSYELRKHKD